MMLNKVFRWMVMALVVCGAIPMALAAEHGGTAVSKEPSPAKAAAAPVLLSAKGTISGLDLQANNLKLTKTEGGQVLALALDPKGTTVWEGSQPMSLTRLKVGEKISVRYTPQAGKQVAKSIQVETAVTAAASTPAGQ